MLSVDLDTGHLSCPDLQVVYSDRPYIYSVRGRCGSGAEVTCRLSRREVRSGDREIVVTGLFGELELKLEQRLIRVGTGVEESITLRNLSGEPVTLSDVGLGFAASLATRPEWRLAAVPFLVQLDGSRHDYPGADLEAGRFHNATYRDGTRPEPPLVEEGRLRSEAWAWWACPGDGRQGGLLVAKYNNETIELSVAAPVQMGGETVLRFGGVGTALYGEPSSLHIVPPGGTVTFGVTAYLPVSGPIEEGFAAYRSFLEARGHGYPGTYDPPVNWNELYDIGWFHSDPVRLAGNYTRDALLSEARKAKACGCELLYLDPGWEVAEGTTLWDEDRLGSVSSLVAELREMGLELGFRTILRCYRDHWPHRHLVGHGDEPKGPVPFGGQSLWEPCICDPVFREQKIERIRAIAAAGVSFIMVDEMDWRGPCSDPAHRHPVPSTAVDHADAVYRLCSDVRRSCPGVTIECHDPVWPWHTAVYAPTYYRQGFGDAGDYDENWGFEYMWDCINDLRTGKALSLYYYNLGCSIPLYLHITMAADNDHCLFFWWAASTIRHLGIGGKTGHPTVNPKDMRPHDPEARFAAYREQMAVYRALKPYFVRGRFHGLREDAHLHSLDGHAGGVLVLFNLGDSSREMTATVHTDVLGCRPGAPVVGASAEWVGQTLTVTRVLEPLAAAVVTIGEAAGR